MLYFLIELSWKRECLFLWSFGIHRDTINVKFTFFPHKTIVFRSWDGLILKKNYKDWALFHLIVGSCRLASEFLTLSETLYFNDNIKNLEGIFWPSCFSFLFWKCRDILLGLVSPQGYVILWHQHRYIQLWHMILSSRRKKGRWLSLWAGHAR